MHLKRNIESPPMPVVSHTPPPPVASKPVTQSAPAAPPASLPKSSSAKINPFSDAPVEKSAKLAALEASGATGYLLVSSTLVCLQNICPLFIYISNFLWNTLLPIAVVFDKYGTIFIHLPKLIVLPGWIIPKGHDTKRRREATSYL